MVCLEFNRSKCEDNYMIFNEKTIVLKNGKTALLKSPEPGDGAKMLDYIKRACGETDFWCATRKNGMGCRSKERKSG